MKVSVCGASSTVLVFSAEVIGMVLRGVLVIMTKVWVSNFVLLPPRPFCQIGMLVFVSSSVTLDGWIRSMIKVEGARSFVPAPSMPVADADADIGSDRADSSSYGFSGSQKPSGATG